jgi:hypothetical protein
MNHNDGFIGPHGNYEELLSYRKAELTFNFAQFREEFGQTIA